MGEIKIDNNEGAIRSRQADERSATGTNVQNQSVRRRKRVIESGLFGIEQFVTREIRVDNDFVANE